MNLANKCLCLECKHYKGVSKQCEFEYPVGSDSCPLFWRMEKVPLSAPVTEQCYKCLYKDDVAKCHYHMKDGECTGFCPTNKAKVHLDWNDVIAGKEPETIHADALELLPGMNLKIIVPGMNNGKPMEAYVSQTYIRAGDHLDCFDISGRRVQLNNGPRSVEIQICATEDA